MITPPHVAEAFAFQAHACASLGSPFMERLCNLFASQPWPNSRVKDQIFHWTGDITAVGDSVPLRLCGALHALKINGDLTLNGNYPPHDVSDDTLWHGICETLINEEAFILQWLKSAPQTNEVRRSAVLIAVGRLLADRFKLPIRTSELGASAGLNLRWDSYGLKLGKDLFGSDEVLTLSPDWEGPFPRGELPNVVTRAGVDLNPLNPKNESDALRLQAYLWPDQPDRLERTKAAIGIADTSVTKADAIDWLSGQLPHQDELLHFIYHTVAWQYFPSEKQTQGTKLIEAAGACATDRSPLAWFGMENDGSGKGAALTLRLWPGDITLNLGRADFHGRWVNWRDEC